MGDHQYEFLGLDGQHEAALTLCAQTAGHASELGRYLV